MRSHRFHRRSGGVHASVHRCISEEHVSQIKPCHTIWDELVRSRQGDEIAQSVSQELVEQVFARLESEFTLVRGIHDYGYTALLSSIHYELIQRH